MAAYRSPLPLPLGISIDPVSTPTVGFYSLFWWMAGLDGGAVAPAVGDSMIDWRRRRRMRRLNIRNP